MALPDASPPRPRVRGGLAALFPSGLKTKEERSQHGALDKMAVGRVRSKGEEVVSVGGANAGVLFGGVVSAGGGRQLVSAGGRVMPKLVAAAGVGAGGGREEGGQGGLREGWQAVVEDATSEVYYWNVLTGETQWEAPMP